MSELMSPCCNFTLENSNPAFLRDTPRVQLLVVHHHSIHTMSGYKRLSSSKMHQQRVTLGSKWLSNSENIETKPRHTVYILP